jgi:glycosyltransferase involved in cell wall biosynthesis
MITVSICCLTYNHRPYIKECLEGFLIQNCNFKFEVLIYDDASTDGTSEIILEYHSKFPDIIKPIIQIENQYSKGVRVNNVYNFSRAKGKYVALCEGDDYWTDPLKLQKQVDFLEENESYSMVHTDYDLLNSVTGEITKCYNASIGMTKDLTNDFHFYFCNTRFVRTLTVCYRKEILDEIIQDFLQNESRNLIAGDSLLNIVSAHFGKVKYLEDRTGVYRRISNSASNSSDAKKIFELKKNQIDLRIFLIRKLNLDFENFSNFFSQQYDSLLQFCNSNKLYLEFIKTYKSMKNIGLYPSAVQSLNLNVNKIKTIFRQRK